MPALYLDRTATTPLHRQIYDAWRSGILAGRFRPGQRVPSTREFANTYGIARATVAQAYEQLLTEGYLYALRGAGTFVCREIPDDSLVARVPKTVASNRAAKIKLSSFGARLTRDFSYPPIRPGWISFARWTPDIAHFPSETWRKLTMRGFRTAVPEYFDYSRQPQGIEALRMEVAAYVARSRAVRCTPDQVVILGGSQQALDFCARLLTEPGDIVAFEDPGYLGTKRIFEAHGLTLHGVPVDNEGIVVKHLPPKARLVYVTPSHQFPTGVAMSLARRLELLAWARRHRAVLVEDDYDSEYRYNGPPLPALQGLADDVAVVYCGTFSKLMFPALRIGYVVLPPALVAPFSRAKWLTDRHAPTLEQAVLAEFLRDGHLDRHVRRMRRLYGHRREILIAALTKHFGAALRIRGDAAGMAVLASFDEDIVARAERNKVQLASTAPYYFGKAPKNEFLFGFSRLGDRAIREGIRRLS